MKNKEQKKCIHCGLSESSKPQKYYPCLKNVKLTGHNFSTPTESKDWRYCSKCKVKFITSDKRDICPQCRGGKAKKLTDEGGEATANFNPLLSSYILQEKEKSYQEGFEASEAESKDIDDFYMKPLLEEARPSAYREIIEMVEDFGKSIRIKHADVKDNGNLRYTEYVRACMDVVTIQHNQKVDSFLSKLKSKLIQK